MNELATTSVAPSVTLSATCRLWLVDLDQPCDEATAAMLSDDEKARAGRFVFDKDRRRFVTARCALRQRLSAETGEAPAALRFAYGAFGKPSLADHPHCAFNLSHAGGTALIGIVPASARRQGIVDIGVDIEAARSFPDLSSLAEASFHRDDIEAFAQATDPTSAFFHGWTRREACLKALGTGLSSLHAIPATGVGVRAATILASAETGPLSLSIESFQTAPGVFAAVACASFLPSVARSPRACVELLS